eukprot:6179742-Pleurochrysis_carterae.AAC.2
MGDRCWHVRRGRAAPMQARQVRRVPKTSIARSHVKLGPFAGTRTGHIIRHRSDVLASAHHRAARA